MEWNGTEFCKKCFLKVNRVFFFVLEWFGTRFQKIFLSLNGLKRNSVCFSLLLNGLERNSEHLYLLWKGLKRNYQVLNVFSSRKWLRMEFQALFIFRRVVRNNITKFRVFYFQRNGSEWNSQFFFIFLGMARNGISSVFRSAKQTEFRRNELQFLSIPCSAEYFFSRKMVTLPT